MNSLEGSGELGPDLHPLAGAVHRLDRARERLRTLGGDLAATYRIGIARRSWMTGFA